MNIRCVVCDFAEDQSVPSLFHNSTTDGYGPRRWIVEPEGPVCEHCFAPEETKEEGETELLIEDDWPYEPTNLPRKGFY